MPNYFAKARVLCKTLKKYNPKAKFALVISDDIPSFIDFEKEPFDYLLETKKSDKIGNKKIFFFKHTITELCTAVKPLMALEIMRLYNADKVIYLDPDIAVFDDLSILESYLDKYSIILTPHQLQPEEKDLYIRENEILFLKRGSFNLGFFGVKADDEGKRFLNWWNTRLMTYCFDDNYDILSELMHDGLVGMFTDQKWIDLVPSFFDNYFIIKEPGYNTCTWNLSHRRIKKLNNGKFTVNDKPLYFYHFSGWDSGGHYNEVEKHLQYYPYNQDVRLLSDWYEKQLKEAEQDKFGSLKYKNIYYSNGEKIQDFERKILHIRKDVYSIFLDPYEVTDGQCYYNWVRSEYKKWFDYFDDKTAEMYKHNKYKRIIDVFFPVRSKRRIWAKKIYKHFLRIVHNRIVKNCPPIYLKWRDSMTNHK